MMTSQPTPTMLPKPKVKYSSAPRVRRSAVLVGGDAKLFLECREQQLGALVTTRSASGSGANAGRVVRGLQAATRMSNAECEMRNGRVSLARDLALAFRIPHFPFRI